MLSDEELSAIRDDLYHASGTIDNPDAQYNPAALKAMRSAEKLLAEVDQLRAEVDRLKSWPGLMATLAELYPPDAFDGSSGDAGAQIIVLAREVDQLRARVAELEPVVEAAKAFAYGGGTEARRAGFTWQHVKALGAAVDALSTSQRDRQET